MKLIERETERQRDGEADCDRDRETETEREGGKGRKNTQGNSEYLRTNCMMSCGMWKGRKVEERKKEGKGGKGWNGIWRRRREGETRK